MEKHLIKACVKHVNASSKESVANIKSVFLFNTVTWFNWSASRNSKAHENSKF